MAWEVSWTRTALEDLEKAADFISKDSPRYASIFARETLEAAQSLRQLADRGRKVPEVQDPNTRELFIMNYRLIYQVDPEAVFSLGLIHGSRDLLALWETEKKREK